MCHLFEYNNYIFLSVLYVFLEVMVFLPPFNIYYVYADTDIRKLNRLKIYYRFLVRYL